VSAEWIDAIRPVSAPVPVLGKAWRPARRHVDSDMVVSHGLPTAKGSGKQPDGAGPGQCTAVAASQVVAAGTTSRSHGQARGDRVSDETPSRLLTKVRHRQLVAVRLARDHGVAFGLRDLEIGLASTVSVIGSSVSRGRRPLRTVVDDRTGL